MGSAPIGVPLAVLAEHYTKAYARLAIAFVTKLMEAKQLRLSCILGANHRARCNDRHPKQRQRSSTPH
jgi:hypothetical protein